MASIQNCPPKPAHILAAPEPQFADRKVWPVDVRFGTQGEIYSNGFAYEDYARGHTESHKSAVGGRRRPCPAWALNASMLAEVIARHFERRAGFRNPTPGNPLERLQRAQQCLLAAIPRQTEIMARLCKEYASLKKLPPSEVAAARLKRLQVEIENIDSQIRLTKEFPAKAARAVYLFWRCENWNSVEISRELGLKPPHIRKLLHGLCLTARQIEKEKAERIQPKIPRSLREPRLREWRARQTGKSAPQQCVICGAEFLSLCSGRKKKTCGSAECKRQRAIRYRRNKRGTPETRSPRHCADCGTELTNVQAKRCKPCKAAQRRRYIREWKKKNHAPTRIPTRILTREEKKILALHLWHREASMGEITAALGYRKGQGYNWTNSFLRNAGVKK